MSTLTPEQRALLDELSDMTGSTGTTMSLGRAFTQGGISSTEPSQSIEVGRANKDNITNANTPNTPNTPPIKMPKRGVNGSRPASVQYSQSRKPSRVQYEFKQEFPPAKAQDNGLGSSRQSSHNYMVRAVNDARIPSDHDMSYISEERPQAEDFTARSSRFGGAISQRNLTKESLPSRFGSKQRFVQPQPQTQPTSMQGYNMPNLPTHSNTGTQQSFAIPTVPNYTELLSGIYDNGKPVYLRDANTQPRQRQTSRPDVAQVDDVTVDDQEQAIYLSLQLLRERVAELERESADKELSVRELQRKNRVLEAEYAQRRSRQRSDSAVGLTDGASDGGDEAGKGPRKLLIEKNRLESSLRALQSQVESTERNATASETTLRNVTKERDSAVSQLGVAYFTIEQLKAENANLADENQALREQLTAIKQPSKDDQASPDNGQVSLRQDSIHQKHHRGEQAPISEEVFQQPPQPKANYDGLSSFERFQAKLAQRQAEREARASAAALNGTEAAGKDAEQGNNANRVSSIQPEIFYAEPHPTDLFPRQQQVHQPARHETSHMSEAGHEEETHTKEVPILDPSSSRHMPTNKLANSKQDFSNVSFVESNPLSMLRKNLEHERSKRRNQKVVDRQPSNVSGEKSQTQVADLGLNKPTKSLPRKTSVKANARFVTDLADITNHSLEEADATRLTKKFNAEHNRRHSEPSVADRREQQHRRQKENMTSAFILPDITIRHPSSGPIRQVSEGAQAVLDEIKYHNGQNCTVCHQLLERDEKYHHHEDMKRTITIPKPIPVSQRMPEPNEWNEEPTIRPSQPPSVALATVMKALEDELLHLKSKLSQYQDLFNGHDAALGRRERQKLGKKIEGLMKDVDVKADQIYALYDVLEGQKQEGHDMTEQEVEVTLQSIGIDATEASVLVGNEDDKTSQLNAVGRRPWNYEISDDEELPWEGIESTDTGIQGQQRRSLSA